MKTFGRLLVLSLAVCLILAGCGETIEVGGGTTDNRMVTLYIPCKFSQVDQDGNVIAETVLQCDKSNIESGKLVITPQSPFQDLAYLEIKDGVYTTCYEEASLSFSYDSRGNNIKTVTTYLHDTVLGRRENMTDYDAQGFMQKITIVTYYSHGESYEYQHAVEKKITPQGVLLSYGDETAWTEYLCNEDGKILENKGYRDGKIVQKNVNAFDEHWNLVGQDIYFSENGKDEAVFQYTLCTQFDAVLVTEEVAALYPMFRSSEY